MKNEDEQFKEQTAMNEKLKYKYVHIKEELIELENDVTHSVTSQFEMLAKNTNTGISEVEKLKDALNDEIELLDDASKMFERMHRSCKNTADEIKTRISEAKHYERHKRGWFGWWKPSPTNAAIDYQENYADHFAQGNKFYKLFWVFFIGCFGGVVIEELFCLVTRGHFESRVGLIYGPFNLVYGLGAMALNIVLYKYRNRSKIYSFLGGMIVGSVIEYFCSYFQELIFGSVSWDYSHMPFNLHGRICLLYSIFWGFLGILWIKEVYPRMAKWILKIPNSFGKILTWVLLMFMLFNSIMSAAVVYRWYERVQAIKADNDFERWVDSNYPDERMEKIFANLEFVVK
ncbi:MAG: putative ABC transporter permease [Erysipelotrichaceae bacterium]|nr:putative ABC transporter permease [Erysipelotrichaceae bacterium]MDY5251238.1 putative ABC transporter permease [Erysipelotrichaceae bacterium]